MSFVQQIQIIDEKKKIRKIFGEPTSKQKGSQNGRVLRRRDNLNEVIQKIITYMDKAVEINASTIQPKKGHQPDKYQGPLHPKTRLRHGIGTYHYPNKYFTFEGNYENGNKSGKGQLRLGDGTVIDGTFENNELIGHAKISYPDGSWFDGNLLNGEKQGNGHYKSRFQQYIGEYHENMKHGKGKYKTSLMEIEGEFKKDKPDGKCTVKKYNYGYEGDFENGMKKGQGKEQTMYHDDNYTYQGQFDNDQFNGKGTYDCHASGYNYEGQFTNAQPKLYPNEFRVLTSTITKLQNGEENQSDKTLWTNPLQYEVQSEMALNIFVQACYQGPQELDPVQPTPEEIEKMVKDWQAQNKKNKNPPPMPDFNQPKMIKPDLVLVEPQSKRPISIKIISKLCPYKEQNGEEKTEMKVDYRSEIKAKKEQNQVLKAEMLKKAEEEGGKKGGKKDPKAQGQFKVNLFSQSPSEKQKTLVIKNEKGISIFEKFELPDDFPQASYQMIISSPFTVFGQIAQFKKELIVKAKAAGKKK